MGILVTPTRGGMASQSGFAAAGAPTPTVMIGPGFVAPSTMVRGPKDPSEGHNAICLAIQLQPSRIDS